MLNNVHARRHKGVLVSLERLRPVVILPAWMEQHIVDVHVRFVNYSASTRYNSTKLLPFVY